MNAVRERDEQERKKPSLIAYSVKLNEGDNPIWTRIGAAWAHQNGEGHTLQLDLNPLDGRIVLLPPKADELAEGGEA